jgi:hypothetical protein
MTRHVQSNTLLFFSFCFIAASWFVGLFLDLQFYYWWFDIVLHTAGGMWVAFFISLLFKNHATLAQGPWAPIMTMCAVIGGAIATGVFVELLEFLIDRFFVGRGFYLLSGAIEDTLSDLFFDIVGATVGYLFIHNKK